MSDVFLTPEGGDDGAALCEHAAAELRAHARTVAELADGVHDGWLGDCAEGRGWAQILQAKSVGANSLRRLVEQHADNLTAIANHFRYTTRPYAATDDNVMGRPWSTL
jgi:hypothetical protein